jgi:hypothetical protein
MKEIVQLEIVPGGLIAPDGEVLDLVELLIEFQEGREPRNGRVYRVLIDNDEVDFHRDSASAFEILHRVTKDSSDGWILYEMIHGKEVQLDPGHIVHFRRHGLERFHTRQLITIEVNHEQKHVRPGVWLVSDLKAATGVPVAKVLAKITHDGIFHNLDDAACIEICNGEKFISHARRGGSS